ncbi:MAG: flavin reductase family protein, partial [Saprospiraceae bacterium]|nr:flavin reductase family protein [Saprospiraceae bacterium]
IDPAKTPIGDFHQFMLGSIAPRPIAFVSTLNDKGVPNLAPYSFFNAFSSNPPTVVFSSNRRISNNTTKDTLHNVQADGELVINAVSYSIVRQMAVASIEFPAGVSEFEKSGLTPISSELVKPYRVKESPVQMECRVEKIIPLGSEGGAGHLVICRVLLIHLREDVLDERDRINPHKIDLMGRMGRAYYVRASGEAIYTILQPVNKIGIGYDRLPASVRQSRILTGNDLGRLAGLQEIPPEKEIVALKSEGRIKKILESEDPLEELHRYAQRELAKENVELAGRIAWFGEHLISKKKAN